MTRLQPARKFAAAATLLLLSLSWLILGHAASPALADSSVRDIVFDRWHVEYVVDTDKNGRAIAQVRETLTTTFPDEDVNKGVVRVIPTEYQKASIDPRDFRVTDETGAEVPFTVEEDDENVGLTIGNTYVHGQKSYLIEYTLSDVVLARDDGTADEFFWDVMGFELRTTTTEFVADISFGPTLAPQLTDAATCFYGVAGSSTECTLTRTDDSFHTELSNLGPHQGVSVAIGLEPGAVIQPPIRVSSFQFNVLPFILGGAAAVIAVAALIARGIFVGKRARARDIIVPNFEVPETLPPLIAGPIFGATKPTIPAELIHLAVNGAIQIEETEEAQGLLRVKRKVTRLRVLDGEKASDALSRKLLAAIFPSPVPGAVFTIPRESSTFSTAMAAETNRGVKEARDRGYFEKSASPAVRAIGFVGLAISAGALAFAVYGFAVHGGWQSIIPLIFGAAGLACSLIAVLPARVHTPLGAETREYLAGVKEFISVVETERIKVLQSVKGAERRADGEIDVVLLYEKLLPYAMLFGLEKQWTKVLSVQYDDHGQSAPLWLLGSAGYTLGSFESSLSSITSSFTSSATYSSSSSGGSSGGGSAGGGGGGGFAGGH